MTESQYEISVVLNVLEILKVEQRLVVEAKNMKISVQGKEQLFDF